MTIPLSEIERFEREYVSLFMLAEERGEHFRRVLKALEAYGVEPAFEPCLLGARLYRRSYVVSHAIILGKVVDDDHVGGDHGDDDHHGGDDHDTGRSGRPLMIADHRHADRGE